MTEPLNGSMTNRDVISAVMGATTSVLYSVLVSADIPSDRIDKEISRIFLEAAKVPFKITRHGSK